jgi:hypothetical protein
MAFFVVLQQKFRAAMIFWQVSNWNSFARIIDIQTITSPSLARHLRWKA